MTPVPSTVLSLHEVRAALVQSNDGATEVRQVDALMDRLETLDEQPLVSLEVLGRRFARLFTTVAGAVRNGALSRELRHDLRVAVEVLDTSIAHLTAPPGLAPLSLDELKLSYARVDLAERVKVLVGHFLDLAAKRDVRLEVEAPASLVCEVDLVKVDTVVLNLLFNAFKHTPIGGHVSVQLAASPGCEDVVLTVFDSGQTVAQSAAEAIFERNRQLERNVFFAGKGLGFNLGVSRAYCQLHGGTLQLYLARTPGCAFRARLSARAPAGAETPAGPVVSDFAAEVATTAARELEEEAHLEDRPIDDRKPIVLIIERSRPLHRVLRQCLTSDFGVASAFDAHRGLADASSLKPDLIIVDADLNGMTGLDLIRALRSQPKPELQEVPILLLASADDQGAVDALQHGAQELLRKPLLLQEVRARVAGLVAAKRAREVLNHALGRNEADLVRLAREMANQQQRLHTALDEVRVARELAEAASQVKSNFLRMISHELRTPIAAMRLYVQALERNRQLDLPREATEGLARIGRVNRRLARLIDTMVEWGRVESNRCRVEVTDFDVGATVEEVFHELESYAREKGVVLKLAQPRAEQRLSSDPRLARLIVMDLVNFALQNTPSGAVEVGFERRSQGLEVTVLDGAPQVGAERMGEIFSPLMDCDDLPWRSGHGSGLGLYVVRDLARAVGGDLGLDLSHRGLGNLFVLELPALTPAEPPGKDGAAPAHR